MFIKLCIAEGVIILPECWEGILLYLIDKPIIIRQLPSQSSANEQTNIRHLPNEEATTPEDQRSMLSYYIPKQYDYYLNCHNASLEMVEEAINLFYGFYEGEPPEAIADADYPMINPLVTLMEIAVKRAYRTHITSQSVFAVLPDQDKQQEPTTSQGQEKSALRKN